MNNFYKLVLVSFIFALSCKDREQSCVFDPALQKATAEISYDLSTWNSSEAVYNSFRIVNETRFIEIKFNYCFPDNINGESLRFYIPLPEIGDVFYFPDGPIASVFSDSLSPSFQFFTTEIDLITEYYELISPSNMPDIVASATRGDFFHETFNFWKFNASSVDSCSS